MDYSQMPHDGSSPWNTSPTQSHGFGGSQTGSEPPSPVPPQTEYRGEPDTPTFSETRDFTDHDTFPHPQVSPQFAQSQQPNQPQQPQQPPQQHAQSQPQQSLDNSRTYPNQQGGSQGKPQAARYQTQGRAGQRNAPHYKLQCKITALERTGKKDIILRFDVQTNLPKFRSTQFRDVRRTHAEFLKLADHLISSNPEAFVPAVPPAVTSAGAGTDEDEARVKGSMQRWLNYVCLSDVLIRDDEMIFFVESDFGYSPVMRMKQPATGVRRKVIKQFAPPPDDTPELHEARPTVKVFYLGTMDAGQKVDKVVKARKALGLAESDLGVKLAQMNIQETHPGLALAYRKLGRTIQSTGDFHAAQGTAEATTFADALNYHSNDAFIVKETLTNRHILLRDLISAQQATRSKLSAADRLKISGSVRKDKVDEAISALDEARSHEQYLGQKTQRVTANLLLEKRKWFDRTSNDLRSSIREYVLREIDAERRTLATLETVRPDIRAIDSSGGLSRLGREAHPATRRASLAASQGPRGDAWSGVQRRGDALNRSVTGGFVGGVPAVAEEEENEEGRPRQGSVSSKAKVEDDEDRVDARNAASRLAASTF